LVLAGSLAGLAVGPAVSAGGAATDPTTVVGQGGSFFEPVIDSLLSGDASNLDPLQGSYLLTDADSGMAAFVGSASGQFAADYTVSQRPLTPAEATTAKADGRTYAYVPIASTPVALATLVPTAAWAASGALSITSSGFCQGIPLSTAELGTIFGPDANGSGHWDDAGLQCPTSGGVTTADPLPIVQWANLDPSQSNEALMTLLDSTPGSKAAFDTGLHGSGSLTTSDTPSEKWPYAQDTVPGGDQPLIGKLLAINAETNAPGTGAGFWQLGAIAPLSSVWTGAPLGVPWDLPTAAVENAASAYVQPTLAAAEASAADATVANTSSPATDNLVTFNAVASDAAAYNNDLMTESYLVVPTDGLPADKDLALAQLIRYALGTSGQALIRSYGSAPATPAMVSAGLKVAAELDAQAVASPTPAVSTATSTTTATSASSSTTSTTTAGGSTTGASSSTGSDTGSGSGSGSGSGTTGATTSTSGLAFTGTSDLGGIVAVGAALLGAGAVFRRRLRRRGVHP